MHLYTKSIVLIFISIQLVTGVARAGAPEQLKRAYVDQGFGMFIHFNMSTFARQPFLSVGGEHEIGKMPAFEDVDRDGNGNINYEDQRSYTEQNDSLNVFSEKNETEMYESLDGIWVLSEKRFKAADTVDDEVFCTAHDNELCKKEYDQVREDLDRFNPTALDIDQWADAAEAAGMRYAVFVTKHHGGFSSWDTGESEYDVAATSWKGVDDEKDIVKLFADAFRARNITVGFYYSIFDKTNGDKYGVPNVGAVKGELADLLNNYGDDAGVLWFDGWGWKYADRTPFYDLVPYKDIEAHIRERSANTIIIENANTWDKAKQEYNMGGPPKNTDVIPFERNFHGLPPNDNKLFVEVSDSIRAVEPEPVGKEKAGQSIWFHHKRNADQLKNLDDIIDDLHTVNSRKATYLLNVTPDTTGRIPPNQVELLEKIGEVKDLEVVNDLVKFDVIQYNAPPTSMGKCPNNDNDPDKKIKYGFKAVLKNISGRDNPVQARVISLLHVKVDTLTNNNVLLLENGTYVQGALDNDDNAREAGQFMVSGGEGLIGAGLTPQSKIEVPFTVCLASTDRFQLFVDVKGVVAFDDTAPALIQSNLGSNKNRLNFEMIVREGDHLCHWWRRNGDESNKWSKSECFAEDVKSAPAFIQSNLGANGNFEVIFRTKDNTLRHYFRDNNDLTDPKWKLGNWSFGEDVASAPALIQSNGNLEKGNLEVVYRDSANRLRHWWRDESTEDKAWKSGGEPFGANVTSAPAMIQSTLHNNLEVVVRESNRLRRYYRNENNIWQKEPKLFGANASSTPVFIQSPFGTEVGVSHGIFGLIVREGGSKLRREGGGLRYYWRDNKPDEPRWHKGKLLTIGSDIIRRMTSAPTLIQSNLDDLKNFEVVVREGDKLVHYFRRNDEWPELPWGTSGEITE